MVENVENDRERYKQGDRERQTVNRKCLAFVVKKPRLFEYHAGNEQVSTSSENTF
jgi:hypothetical protein